jgi:hypothetical protein
MTGAAAATAVAWSTAALADLTPAPTPTSTTSTSASALPVLVTLSGVDPLAPQPGDRLTVRGTLTVQGTSPVSNLTVQLAVSRTKVGSRDQFDTYAATSDGAQPVDAVVPSTETTGLSRTDLGVGASEPFTVSVPVDDLQLPQVWQVYEMTVVVTGDTVTGRVSVGRLRTFLPWAPVGVPGVGLPTRLAWVWPVVDRPHRSDSTTWVDDALASSLAGGGRLDELVAAGAAAEAQAPPPMPAPRKGRHKNKHRQAPPSPPRPTVRPVPVTWAIDPQLLDDATAMTGKYAVSAAAGGTRPGRGGTAARQWLAALKSAVGSGSVFGLPYGDPDDVAAVHAGLGTEVQLAHGIGDQLIESTLGRDPLPYAWPPNGLLDERTLDTLFAAGETTMVLDSNALPIVGGPPSVTPGAHAAIRSRDGNFDVDVLLADHILNQVVDAGARSAAAGPLAIQRLLSELLMVQAQQPGTPRSLVITPSRRWAPSASYAAAVLADTGQVPWIRPTSLSQVAAEPVYDAVQREPLHFTADNRDLLLRHSYLSRVSRLKHQVDAFAAIVPRGDSLARGFHDGLLRLLSSAWRADPAGARTVREALVKKVQHTVGKVRIASHKNSLVTLTSHSGTVPVTVTNDLDSPVRIVVELEPDQHLVVKSTRVAQTIPAHRQVPVDVRATAQTSGVFRLTVRLATPPPLNRHYGAAVPLRIRSTAYGATALLITGGATAVLLLTVIVRLVRRARAARKSVPLAT